MHFPFILFLALISCQSKPEKKFVKAKATRSDITFETLLKRNDVIWGFDFLPDGKVILTERGGAMLLFDPVTKKTSLIKGVPKVYSDGQAGLLDVRIHPNFKQNSIIYFSYSEPIGESESTTALAMGVLQNNEITSLKKLFSGKAPNSNDIHYGSRIEFDLQGHLYLTMGDRDERNRAQNLDYHQGKVLRFNLDGSVPTDNPFVANKESQPEIWSYGHRNPQGLTRHPETQEIWEAEMGPQGGDEVNRIHPGKNYGWPKITYGREYYGPKIGEYKSEGMEQPFTYWVPSISPSGIAFYHGDKFPEWKNDLFLGTLSGTHIHRVKMDSQKVLEQEELLKELDYRWRSVRSGPDGYLYLGTDEGRFGRVIKK